MNIYISAPISGRTAADNDFLFEYTKGQLEYYGHKVINPWAIGKLLPKLSHDQYLAIDREIIKHAADAVFFAPGWIHSDGCKQEYEFCKRNEIQIYEDIAQIAKEAEP